MTATTTARAYVRAATAGGALIARPGGRWVENTLDALVLQLALGKQMACEHAGAARDEDLVVVPTFGPQMLELLCEECWEDPGPDYGCQSCDRSPVIGLRVVVSSPMPGRGMVLLGRMCKRCRGERL